MDLKLVIIICLLSKISSEESQENIQDYDRLYSGGTCEPLNDQVLTICKDIAYNETRLPNFFKQKSLKEAASEAAVFLPLIRINCSPILRLFLCSLYAPPCVKNYETLKPCKEMCEKAKSGCDNFIHKFSFPWSDYIDCNRFPSFNGAEACITDENYSFQTSSYSKNKPSNTEGSNLLSNLTPLQQQLLITSLISDSSSGSSSKNNQNLYQLYAALIAAASSNSETRSMSSGLSSVIRIKFTCPPVLQTSLDHKSSYYLVVNDEPILNCAMPCDNNLFETEEIAYAKNWVLVWSALCFGSTLITILTFLIDTTRFRYPERPIILLSGCYMIVALGYLIGSSNLINNSICSSVKNGNNQMKEYLLQGVDHLPCTFLFMMTYFFGMSSSIWWVNLTVTWYLAAGKKWGHEAIENISCYFHLAAWGIPGIKLIILLWLQKVEADVLSGICYTGIRNMNILRGFVLAPLFVYLIFGTVFLLAGFVSLMRIRNMMKDEGNKTDKLEKFMIRIVIFSILYMGPAITLISCYYYEQSSYNKWIDYWLRKNQNEFNLPPDYVATSLFEKNRDALVFSVFLLKYAMILIVGISSSFWIWSPKTITSWKNLFEKIVKFFKNFKNVKYQEAAV